MKCSTHGSTYHADCDECNRIAEDLYNDRMAEECYEQMLKDGPPEINPDVPF